MNYLAALDLNGITLIRTYLCLCIGVVESFDEPVSNRVCSCLERVEFSEVEAGFGHRVFDMVHDVSLNALNIVADVVPHQIPELLVSFSFMRRNFFDQLAC